MSFYSIIRFAENLMTKGKLDIQFEQDSVPFVLNQLSLSYATSGAPFFPTPE